MNVETKQELDAARAQGVRDIVVLGALADKLHRSRTIAKLSAASLAALAAVVGVAVVTGPETLGLSMFAASGVAAMTGVEIAAIITASSLGLALVVAIWKGYESIGYEAGRLELRRRVP